MIGKAIARAYQVMHERGYDTIYWAIDLHGVCMKSNYTTGSHEFINQSAIDVLKMISDRPESKIILWSSVHDSQKHAILELFAANGITVHGFNNNPYERNTETGCFDEKFYFSILLDDKAGFDLAYDWSNVRTALTYEVLKLNMENQ